jgi:hypothetical protein
VAPVPTIFLNVVSCVLGTGEAAEFTFYTDCTNIAGAVDAAEDFMVALSTDAAFRAVFYTNVTFGPVKVSSVDQATGHVIATAMGTTSFSGSGLEGSLPPQCAIVVTLRTAFAGPSDTGRIYLPQPSVTITNSAGRLLDATAQSIADSVGDAFTALNANGSALTGINVYSRKNRLITPVLSVDVGNVIDTQRRRRDGLVEVRFSSPV